jgi:N-acetylmuramoyl-L-alanine amidase
VSAWGWPYSSRVLTVALAAAALLAGSPQGLAGKTVVIDPGHNGGNGAHPERINRHVPIGGGQTKACDTTGTATSSGYSEARYNLAVAREVARILRRDGATVTLTRTGNGGVGPCIDERARIGNRAAADAAVSIHADGGPPGGRGFHVIHPTRIDGLTDDIFGPSRRLARKLRWAYAARTGLPPATYLGGNGIVQRSDLGGLRLSDVPKVFIETGNMRNASDAAMFESRRGRLRIARGIADGLRQYLQPTIE